MDLGEEEEEVLEEEEEREDRPSEDRLRAGEPSEGTRTGRSCAAGVAVAAAGSCFPLLLLLLLVSSSWSPLH